MRPSAGLLLGLLALPLFAAAAQPELVLQGEHAIDGMAQGNLSGLAECGGALWGESDRDDDRLYRFERGGSAWRAEPRTFDAPAAPDTGLDWKLRATASAAAVVRGGAHDFEGVSCDAQGNTYLVSEAHAAVLKIPAQGAAQWLPFAPEVIAQARKAGMLQHFNAIFEGLAVSPDGKQLWLAAEREKRGLLRVRERDGQWGCDGSCVLLSEGGSQPSAVDPKAAVSLDFSDLALYRGKLFTLERNAYRICRRDAASAKVEACWSFAGTALAPQRRYREIYGLTEALALDDDGAWVGTDNNQWKRQDGETRPVVWRFAAPAGGWMGTP